MFRFVQTVRTYRKGQAPHPKDLASEYAIHVPCFPWVSLSPLRHKKHFSDQHGNNKLLGMISFGDFSVRHEDRDLVIDYDVPQNWSPSRRLIDRVRKTPDGRLIGILAIRISGQEIPLTFFEMT